MEYILLDSTTKRPVSVGCQNFESELDCFIFESLQQSLGREVVWGPAPESDTQPEATGA